MDSLLDLTSNCWAVQNQCAGLECWMWVIREASRSMYVCVCEGEMKVEREEWEMKMGVVIVYLNLVPT